MSDYRERDRGKGRGASGSRRGRGAMPAQSGAGRAQRAGNKRGWPNAQRRGRTAGVRARKGGGRPGRSKLPQAVVKQVKAMVAQSGIPFNAAVKVVQGKTTLNEVLQSLLREEKIRKLMEIHGINRALATNVALGRTDLDVVLLRRRKNATLQKFYQRSCLEESRRAGSIIALALHGHSKVRGHVLENNKYTILFQPESGGEPTEIHKTTIKYGYDPKQYKLVKKFIKVDKRVRALNLDPIRNPRDRHHFKNLTLQRAMDDHLEVLVVTLEGDTLKGHVEWFGRWEFGLGFKGGAKATVFRHAVYALTLLER